MSSLPLTTIQGQPSWPIKSSLVKGWLTQLGGHLGPVQFQLGRKIVQPYSVAPWAEEPLAAGSPAILRALRGDFFCCPFGGNATPWRGEQHPPHGETANATWRPASLTRSGARVTLQTSLATTVRKGRVDKFISLIDGHTAIYSRHILTGMTGPMNVGHHATLKFPARPGSGVISTSRFIRGQVLPEPFELPENGGYQSLKPGAVFHSLQRVPRLDGGQADLSLYPARRGYEDLALLTADPRLPFAWTAVTFPAEGYVWFALRDPRVLRHTVMWISNGGRHYAPWNGRHTDVMGLEDITGYFHLGLAESARPNLLNRRGIPTTLKLHAQRPTSISTIMAMAVIPKSFDRVAAITVRGDGVDLVAANGRQTHTALDLSWLTPAAAMAP